MSRKSKSRETEGSLVVAWGWGKSGWWGDGGMTARGYSVSFGDDKNVLKVTVVMAARLLKMLKTIEFYG